MSCVADAQCLRCVYTREVGVKEEGWNRGERIRQYLEAVHLKEGNPWCAAFVVWCHKQCRIPIKESGFSPVLFPKEKVVKEAMPMDVFGIYYKSKQRIAHVGFIDIIERNAYITVEGNTGPDGTREGDGVYRKKRMKSQVYKISRWHTGR